MTRENRHPASGSPVPGPRPRGAKRPTRRPHKGPARLMPGPPGDLQWLGEQGGQGRTGAQICTPRPAPPSKLCAPRPASQSAPAQMGEPGHPAAGWPGQPGPRPTRPSSPGLQAVPLTRPGPAVVVCCASSATAGLLQQVQRCPGRGLARSPLCLPRCPSIARSCLFNVSISSRILT